MPPLSLGNSDTKEAGRSPAPVTVSQPDSSPRKQTQENDCSGLPRLLKSHGPGRAVARPEAKQSGAEPQSLAYSLASASPEVGIVTWDLRNNPHQDSLHCLADWLSGILSRWEQLP